MSEEYEVIPEQVVLEPVMSSFVPLLILLTGFVVWFGWQDYKLNEQRLLIRAQLQAAQPTLVEAQNVSTRYVKLMKDLVQTAQKNAPAAEIVKAAIQGGLIHVQPNATAPPATAPAPAAPPAPDSK